MSGEDDAAFFIGTFTDLQEAAHENAVAHGWWEDRYKSDAECIALMHAELSEALEAMRDGNPRSAKIRGFSCVEEEFADVIIRIMDLAGMHRLNVAEAIIAKMNYNKTRPYKHGGKAF
jgi:NTP pyrophosphatase (non-canonical NTP hydrolase)